MNIVLVIKGLPDLDEINGCCTILDTLTQQDDLAASVIKNKPDAVVLDMRNPSPEFFHSLKAIQQNHPVPIVVFSQDDTKETIQLSVQAGVMAYIVDAFNSQRIISILEAAIARFNHFQAIQHELDETKTELANRKAIDKAKGHLMKHKNISENDAYKLLRETAMQQKKKIIDIANSINSTINLLN